MEGGANNAVNSAGASISDLSNSGAELVSRSPEPAVGVSQIEPIPNLCKQHHLTTDQQSGVGDVLAGTASGTDTLLSGGVNNLLNSAGNSVADVSNSAGDVIN